MTATVNTMQIGSDMSRTAVLGFSSGIILVAATLVAIALMNFPGSAGAAVGEPQACPLAEVPLDQGYGVSRTGLRPQCSSVSTQSTASTSVK